VRESQDSLEEEETQSSSDTSMKAAENYPKRMLLMLQGFPAVVNTEYARDFLAVTKGEIDDIFTQNSQE